MDNKEIKKDYNMLSKSFKDDFEIPENTQNNPLSKTIKDINNYKYHQQILGNSNKIDDNEINETAFESKIKHKLTGNIKDKKRGSLFISGKDMNKAEFRESLKGIGLISSSANIEALILRKMPTISQHNFDKLKNKYINIEILSNLYDYLQTVNCNFTNVACFESVGGISPLTYLVESKFQAKREKEKEMNDKYNILKNFIYNYRTINGDGNCFYRAVMFRYLEILILSKNTECLQNVIFDIINSFASEELNSRTNIRGLEVKPDLTLKILFLIVDLIQRNMVMDAHKILVKSFSTCKKFDYSIILYFRYILYDYIKNNENKVYLKTFPIKIGNLLPSQYETKDGKFLFNSFYESYLLNFFTDAEKIVIYLTPFVLGVELNIIIFDDNEEEILQKFKWEGKSELKIDEVISLLNSRNHYEIIYTPNDYKKNKDIFQIYENNQKPIILQEEEEEQQNLDDSCYNLLNSNFNISLNNEIKEDFNKKNKTTIYKKSKISDSNNLNQINNKNNQNNINKQINSNLSNNKINNNIDNNNENNNMNKIKNKNYNYKNHLNQNYNIENNNNQFNQKNNNYPNYQKDNNQYQNYYSYNNDNNDNNDNNRIINNNNLKSNNNIDYNYKISQPNSARYNNQFSKNNQNEVNKSINNNQKNITKIKRNSQNYYNKRQINQNQYRNYNTNENKKINMNNPTEEMESKNNQNNSLQNKLNSNNNITNQNPKNIGLKTPQGPSQSNISSNSNISPIGFSTPDGNRNQNKCLNCGSFVNNQNISICKLCFKAKIIDFVYISYIKCISENLNLMEYLDGNIEIQFNKKENIKKFSLDEALVEYNKIFKNENLDKKQIIDEIKKKICVSCQEEIKNNEYYELPCKCRLCSKEDLDIYLSNIDLKTGFLCLCGTQYTREMIFKLGVLTLEIKVRSQIKFKKYFQNQLMNKCCICGKTSNITHHYSNIINSKQLVGENINRFLNKLTHYFCENCYINNKDNGFNCLICKINHYFENMKK